MARQLPRVDGRYGAPMGRADKHNRYWEDKRPKIHLREVPIDSGGYDRGGAYWGLRYPTKRRVLCLPLGSAEPIERDIMQSKKLWWYYNKDGTISAFIDAFDREEAREAVLTQYKYATFYR